MTTFKNLLNGDKILDIEKNRVLVVCSDVQPDDVVTLENGKVQNYLITAKGNRVPYDFMATTLEDEVDENGFGEIFDFLMEEEGIVWKRLN